MSKHQEENPRNHPRWVPLNVIIKVNVEESPSRFTLEGLHDRVVSEVVKEEITLDDHDRIATLQVNIRSAVEVSPSALNSNTAESSNEGT